MSIYDGRPNGELLLATGTLEAGNPAGAQGRGWACWGLACALLAVWSDSRLPACCWLCVA